MLYKLISLSLFLLWRDRWFQTAMIQSDSVVRMRKIMTIPQRTPICTLPPAQCLWSSDQITPMRNDLPASKLITLQKVNKILLHLGFCNCTMQPSHRSIYSAAQCGSSEDVAIFGIKTTLGTAQWCSVSGLQHVPRFNPERGLLSVWSHACSPCVLVFTQLPKHWLCAKLPLGGNVCVHGNLQCTGLPPHSGCLSASCRVFLGLVPDPPRWKINFPFFHSETMGSASIYSTVAFQFFTTALHSVKA